VEEIIVVISSVALDEQSCLVEMVVREELFGCPKLHGYMGLLLRGQGIG
jgi:hypothetical protein